MAPPLEIFLVDNGSLRPESTFTLRSLAEELTVRIGVKVEPVSLLHSHKVPAAKLRGVPARIVKPRLRDSIQAGVRQFILLPLFLGPSRAITEYLPELIEEAGRSVPDLRVIISSPLAGAIAGLPDPRLASILAHQVRQTIVACDLSFPQVALVDHGTPAPEVNEVRNAVASQLEELLQADVDGVFACSMERRPGPEYAFNEPLLENLGFAAPGRNEVLITAMFFLLPGRHAGAGGDVETICNDLIVQGKYSAIHTTPLLAEHPQLLDILEDRFREAFTRLGESGV